MILDSVDKLIFCYLNKKPYKFAFVRLLLIIQQKVLSPLLRHFQKFQLLFAEILVILLPL